MLQWQIFFTLYFNEVFDVSTSYQILTRYGISSRLPTGKYWLKLHGPPPDGRVRLITTTYDSSLWCEVSNMSPPSHSRLILLSISLISSLSILGLSPKPLDVMSTSFFLSIFLSLSLLSRVHMHIHTLYFSLLKVSPVGTYGDVVSESCKDGC